MECKVTTTGTVNPVVIADLGVVLNHPTTDQDLCLTNTGIKIRGSADLQAAIDAGEVTLKDEYGDPITSLSAPCSHTIASHRDTTATGAELNTLTDGSNADALHTHAGGGASYDRKLATATAEITTTSGAYIDIPGMTLTTGNLGEAGTYVINFSAEWNCVSTQKKCHLALLVNGSIVAERSFTTPDRVVNAAEFASASMSWVASGVANGTIIKVQWKETESATFRMGSRQLVIDGVPDSQVV